MTLESALSVLRRFFVDDLGDDARDPKFAIVSAELREGGWLFEFTSSEFLRSRSFLHALGGNRPLLVRADGSAIQVDEPGMAGEPVCTRAS